MFSIYKTLLSGVFHYSLNLGIIVILLPSETKIYIKRKIGLSHQFFILLWIKNASVDIVTFFFPSCYIHDKWQLHCWLHEIFSCNDRNSQNHNKTLNIGYTCISHQILNMYVNCVDVHSSQYYTKLYISIQESCSSCC